MTVANIYDDRLVVFFDIDDTLYSSTLGILKADDVRVQDYFASLGVSHEKISELCAQYRIQYGMVARGLQYHHGVDPIDYEKKRFGSLPLEDMLSPDPLTRKLLEDIDRSKCRVWALTNAYHTHAERVLQILNLRDQFEGVLFCDYEEEDIVCKPDPAFYRRAMQRVGAQDPAKCLFLDDTLRNVEGAKRVGWIRSVHFREQEHEPMTPQTPAVDHTLTDQEKLPTKDGIPVINNLQQLRSVWPDIFVKAEQ